MTWQILIATIPHRHEALCGLLAEIAAQYQPGLGVIVYRDNCEATVAAKRQALLDAATADYVCFVDDDDMIAPSYVAMITAALRGGPDYVGFRIRYLVDGENQTIPAEHSLRYLGWRSDNAGMFRDISHLNPMKRELALAGRFEGGYSEDSRWADQVRASGRVVTEEFIGADLYWYRFSTTANSHTAQYKPLKSDVMRPLPYYPWLVPL